MGLLNFFGAPAQQGGPQQPSEPQAQWQKALQNPAITGLANALLSQANQVGPRRSFGQDFAGGMQQAIAQQKAEEEAAMRNKMLAMQMQGQEFDMNYKQRQVANQEAAAQAKAEERARFRESLGNPDVAQGFGISPQQAQALQGAPDDVLDQFLPKALERQFKGPDFKEVGGVLYRVNPDGSTQIEADSRMLPPDVYAQKVQLAQAGASRNSTNVVNVGEKEFDKNEGKRLSEVSGSIAADARLGNNITQKANRIESLLGGINTGALTPVGMQVAQAAASLGIQIDPNLPQKEAAAVLSKQLAMDALAGFKGPTTDRELGYSEEQVPNLTQSPEGRKMIIEGARRAASNANKYEQLRLEYIRKNGRLDSNFEAELNREMKSASEAFSAPPKSKDTVSKSALENYALTHKIPVTKAREFLRAQGYEVE